MKRGLKLFLGWCFFALGILMLVCCTWVGVLIAHLVPIVIAGLVIYLGLRYLSDA